MQMNHREIFKYEYKRCFFWKMQLWVLLCFCISAAFFWYEYRESEEDVLYKDIVGLYQGASSQQKIDEIKEKTAHYAQALIDHDAIANLYARNGMSDEEFEQFMEDYRHAKKYMNSWERLESNALRFEEQSSSTYFFYDTAWNKLFSNQIGVPFLLLLIPLLIPYFYLDADSGFESMGESYCNYRQIKKYRLRFALIFLLLLQVIWMAKEFVVILFTSSLPHADMSACSLSVCSEISGSVSLLLFYILRNIILLLKRILDTFLIYFLADRIKGKMQTTVIILIYLLATDWYYLELLRWLL